MADAIHFYFATLPVDGEIRTRVSEVAHHFRPLLIVGRDTTPGVEVEGPELDSKVSGAEVTLGLGAGIGLKRHAHQRASAQGRREASPRSRRKQGGVRGVGFAEGFAQDRVHLIVARSGGEGDEAALFQIAQNALAGR